MPAAVDGVDRMSPGKERGQDIKDRMVLAVSVQQEQGTAFPCFFIKEYIEGSFLKSSGLLIQNEMGLQQLLCNYYSVCCPGCKVYGLLPKSPLTPESCS